VQSADSLSTVDAAPDYIAVDETAIKVNDECH